MRPCFLLLAALLLAGLALSHASVAAAAAEGGLQADATSTTSKKRLAAPAVVAGVPLPPDWRSEATNDTQAWVLKQATSPEGAVIFTTFALLGRKAEGARPPLAPHRARDAADCRRRQQPAVHSSRRLPPHAPAASPCTKWINPP